MAENHAFTTLLYREKPNALCEAQNEKSLGLKNHSSYFLYKFSPDHEKPNPVKTDTQIFKLNTNL